MEPNHAHFVGMHFWWWMFWVVLMISFFSVTTPVRRSTVRRYQEDPLGILKRRFASGELTADEFEDMRRRLLQGEAVGI